MTTPFVHPTAVVDEGVTLGEDAAVWHFSHVSAGAVIGPGTKLGQNTFVGRGVNVGARVKVQNNVSIYEGVEIEDDAFIGPSVVFTNVKTPRAFVDRRAAFEATRVGRGASIGANAVIVCGHAIGAYALVGAGAVVTSDVPAHAIVAGNPARRIGWASKDGSRLAQKDPEKDPSLWVCPSTGERYRVTNDACVLAPPEDAPVAFVDLARAHAPIANELTRAFERVVARGKFILGDEVRALEADAAKRVGVRFAIGVSSGTDAILASLMALGVGIGDEVVTSPFSFFAGVEAILRLGATPVFADLEERGFHVDPERVDRAIGPHTKAILVPHLFGAAFSAAVAEVARARGVPLVEDAAQAFGVAASGGARCGSIGRAGCFSFFPTKSLGALGDGGLVTTDDEALAERIRALRSHGSHEKYRHALTGGNFRLDELQAAFLNVKLARFDDAIAARRRLARRYLDALADFAPSRLVLPSLEPGDTAAYFVVRARERDRLAAHLKVRGVATEVYYPLPLHHQPAVLALNLGGSNPRAERACSEALALPLHEAMSEAEVDRVARAIAEFLF
ncbi:MAG: DegT/DnrJ/EryC1/StrS family aminotransferase [Polyangiaceae bacterium]